MKASAATLTIACALFALPLVAHAKGGHGGGHAGGGHRSGHSTSGGHASGTSSHRTTAPPVHVRPSTGQPPGGSAVPRPTTTPVVAPPFTSGSTLLPSRPLFVTYGFGSPLYPWWWPAGADAFEASRPPEATGGLRLDVEPESAQVFVDGYYVGTVGDFNGRFHHLDLDPGPHRLEIRAEGYQPVAVDIAIQAHHTISYRGALTPR